MHDLFRAYGRFLVQNSKFGKLSNLLEEVERLTSRTFGNDPIHSLTYAIEHQFIIDNQTALINSLSSEYKQLGVIENPDTRLAAYERLMRGYLYTILYKAVYNKSCLDDDSAERFTAINKKLVVVIDMFYYEKALAAETISDQKKFADKIQNVDLKQKLDTIKL